MDPKYFSMKSPEESYSRQLDEKVQSEEKPYGYEMSPPPADSGDYSMKSRNSNKQYKSKDY